VWVKIDWLKNTIQTETDIYPLKFWTNDRLQTQTYQYGGQRLVMYFNKNAQYIGHLVIEDDLIGAKK
jgi:hypothetical protein